MADMDSMVYSELQKDNVDSVKLASTSAGKGEVFAICSGVLEKLKLYNFWFLKFTLAAMAF
jgi:hypothetical protein